MVKILARALCVCWFALTLPSVAPAQQSKDTLRVAYRVPIMTSDVTVDPQPETVLTSSAIWDTLIIFDPETRQFRPSLAQSWIQVDPLTLEFALRRGIKFHDGRDFIADDVVYTIEYLTNPASKLRFATNYAWIDRAEKVDDFKVRIIAKSPTPYALARLSSNLGIFPAAVHGALSDKSEFGRKVPIGTGPYRLDYLDPSKGMMLSASPNYQSPGPWRPAAHIKRIQILPIPDVQTQMAHLMTDGLDMILDASKDEAEQLQQLPNLAVSPVESVNYHFMAIDSVNRSGNTALNKPEVRKALMMAVDRSALIGAIIAGGSSVKRIDSMCAPTQTGCVGSVAPAPFDRSAARELLKSAGYGNGFDVEITTIPGSEKTGLAIAGMFSAIGVRATVDNRTFVSFRAKQSEGKIQVLVSNWSSGGLSDVVATPEYFFGAPSRDYWNDEQLKSLSAQAASEMDPKKRDDLYRRMFDRMNSEFYFLPISTMPAILVHARAVEVPAISRLFSGVEFEKLKWK